MSVKYLLLVILIAAPFTLINSQNDAIYFSVNIDPLEPLGSNYGGFIKHDWGLTNGWYLSAGLGFWSWEEKLPYISPRNHQQDNFILNITPESNFALQSTFATTDGNIGYRRELTHDRIQIHVPIFLNFGREWLKNLKRLSLRTDVGLMGAYFHEDLYGWEDWIAIQDGLDIKDPVGHINEFGDPTFWFVGKTIRRSLDLGISVNIATTYLIGDNAGIGINIFMGGYFTYLGYSTIGTHFFYLY